MDGIREKLKALHESDDHYVRLFSTDIIIQHKAIRLVNVASSSLNMVRRILSIRSTEPKTNTPNVQRASKRIMCASNI